MNCQNRTVTKCRKAVKNLEKHEVARMFELMSAHFDNMDLQRFQKDLEEKEGLLLLYNEEGIIEGFSTYLVLFTSYQGEAIRVLFSGDTILNKAIWGAREHFELLGELIADLLEQDESPLYWFLLSKGYRTYLLLSQLFNSFYPHYQKAGSQTYEAGLAKHLAGLKYPGKTLLEKENVLTLPMGADFLKDEIASIPKRRLKNPHINFFLQSNPGYTFGTELVCLAELKDENMSAVLRKFLP